MLSGDEEDDSPQECREKRRRTIGRRRLEEAAAASSGGGGSTSFSSSGGLNVMPESSQQGDSAGDNINNSGAEIVVPMVGSLAVAGRQRDMEDAITVRTNLCSPEITRRRPVHFFGVYDGHGGSHVASMCKDKMHVILQDELTRVGNHATPHASGASSSRVAREEQSMDESGLKEEWTRVLKSCFMRMEEVVLNTCSCGIVGLRCSCDRYEVNFVGSTAVVAVLTPQHVVVANCGDSRAVLCRGGRVVPLSFDHKPDREDERARMEACGGRVVYLDGARVEGILAMSRAIGDRYLKPFVISEPEISFTKRDEEDEFLILASDGLWDVMSNEMTCEVARECLREENRHADSGDPSAQTSTTNEGPGTLFPSQSASAAALLIRLALGRKSADNICVIVVDLKRTLSE
ncbi:probable protein phosphatase 2C 75 [Olea europaea var. sylvestris]|uniref:protein-serine/threonine phosphatase n=1 Tax=Olea europaea subsp. europaea TaxID=158383 RepID=A0A8S0U9B6_OLEEU|nr:probable protein phosphatase 2C 75 [Olea europaea var. sylvestris]CAA3013285.1 probable phosphatase 2C 75 [Olea europaea subsp. europaea]